MYMIESTIGKSIDLEVTNEKFKYSMCKMEKTVKLTQCVNLIEPINEKRL